VDGLERAFRSFKAAFHSESTLSDSLKAHGATIELADAWQPLGTRFAKLRQFCGGLATFFPGTDTLESDFSALKWEHDEFRSTLIIMEPAREGITQCKQIKKAMASLHRQPEETSLVPGLISY
jgi:hypothetical protein